MFNSFVIHSFWKHQSREDAVSNLMLSNLWLKEEALALDGTWWQLNWGNNGIFLCLQLDNKVAIKQFKARVKQSNLPKL